jgi:Fe-S cluster assembly protein SufD
MKPMIKEHTEQIEQYLSNFEKFEKGLNGESKSPVHMIRKNALDTFTKLGFPTTRNEEWKFTSVLPIAQSHFAQILNPDPSGIKQKDVDRFLFPGLEKNRLVFVNGHFSKELSSITAVPKNATVENLAEALRADKEFVEQHLSRYARFDENAFTALNTGFMKDGAFIKVPDGVIFDEPVFLLFVATKHREPFVTHPRNLVVVGKNAQISVVERYVSLDEMAYFTNAVTEIVAGENSVIEHDKLQQENTNAFHVGSLHITMEAKSNFTSNSFVMGGSLVRNDIVSVLGAEGIECTLNGLSLATGKQHIDNHTTIDHAKPHCNSHELYKSILDGKSKGVFNGKIFVRKDAQKTDAKQTNKTLLLSDEATIDTKPQLEIFADDVKCTHGATVGHLDAEAVFYLRSRGIGYDLARDILTYAFASDVTRRVKIEAVRNELDHMILERLHQGRQMEGI